MNDEIDLGIKISKEEINKIKDMLVSAKGLRHYAIKLNSGEYLDLVKYKDFHKLETNWEELKKWLEEELEKYQKQFAQATTDLEDRINYTRCYCFKKSLNKILELESGNNE